MTHPSAKSQGGVGNLAWNLETLSRRPADMPPPLDIRGLIGQNSELPPLPMTTRRLLDLQQDPNANVAALARVVETDALLAPQMLRWANSALYALRGEVTSVRDAINRTLGFETAMALALGLTSLTPLRTPDRGPIGHESVWRQGVTCADLMLRLTALLAQGQRPQRGHVQLAALTHNIGYLVLGHLLDKPFAFLSQLIEHNPGLDWPVLERFALGVDHTQLGLWLFETWEMPEPLRHATRHHHNPAYEGPDQGLVLLCVLADQLLAATPWGLGPPCRAEEIAFTCERLGLAPADAQGALDETSRRVGQGERDTPL